MAKHRPHIDEKWKKLSQKVGEAGNAFRDESPLTDAERAEAAELRDDLVQVAKTHEARLKAKESKQRKKTGR